MAHAATISLQTSKLNAGGVATRLGVPALFIGAVALIGEAWRSFSSASDDVVNHFFYSYLAAYTFFMAITLGSMAFVLIQHLTRAGWSVTVRRIAEGLSMNMFLLVILTLPLFLKVNGESGAHRLLHWFDFNPHVAHPDEVQAGHYGYLNREFFAWRLLIYLSVWSVMAWYYWSRSGKQDQTGDPRTTVRMERWAMPGMYFFGFSLTAFIIDWVMSLNPYWFSTIFGVYYFAGCMLSALSAIVLISLAFQKRGLIGNAVSHEHYHDIGKLMFAFTFFWGYIAFAQYMLIWYANMPEETQFFIPRQFERWAAVSLTLLIVHLLIPFPGLISRHVKRRNRVLAFWSVWSICACALDIYWLVVPNEWIHTIPAAAGNPRMPISNALALLTDPKHIYHLAPGHEKLAEAINFPLLPAQLGTTALCFLGMGGLYIFSTMLALKSKALVPLRDPRLEESLAFENI